MRRRTAERLAELYPQVWRDRFGNEFVDLLETEELGPRVLLDVGRAALAERVLNVSGLEDQMAYVSTVVALARRPSGFIPVLMSVAALATVIAAISIGGVARRPDEGTAAHIFQLLIIGELPLLAFFALRWISKNTWATLTMLSVQAVAIGVAIFPVWYFRL